MTATDIYNTPRYTVRSYGNGESYLFTNKATGQAVHAQGDDAITFREELNAYETANPNTPFDDILDGLWDIYRITFVTEG
jgi:hypothetical protein